MECKQKGSTKDKRRNNEKRKEKSRDAARCRRSKETEIFADLAAALPLSQEQVSQLDKASIMRLAISYLRVRDMVGFMPNLPNIEENINEDESAILKSLEGFLLVLSSDGDFVYISENVSEYIGIAQIDLMGQNIYDYSHPCDHEEIRELLSDKSKNNEKPFFIRLKCTLTSKGRSVNLKSANYKVLHCKGHMLRTDSNNDEPENKGKNCFAAIAKLIPHPSNIETPLPKQTFVTKHSLDMKFIHADDEIMKDVLGYKEDELLGKCVYEYHHAMDTEPICSAYKCLFSKGQCETGKYRFLAKNGGYVWVSTQATLIYDKMQKPQSVVCVNYVISGIECENEVYSAVQLSSVKTDESLTTVIDNSNVVLLDESLLVDSNIVQEDKENILLSDSSEDILSYIDGEGLVRPKRNTEKILIPRTKEMSRGFLTFTDDSGLTMLKEEPDDLTHLAPVAGDVCVPLVEHPFLTDVLDDLLLKDNFSPLIMDEPMDPFISYRETYDVSPALLSPNLSKTSDSSAINSPSNSLGEDDHISSFMNYSFEEDKSESSMRSASPYIPMNMDELPLLLSSSSDLMWSTDNSSAQTSPVRKITKDSSSLAQLLETSVKTSKSSDNMGQSIWCDKTNMVKSESTNFNGNKRTNSSNTIISNKRMKTEQTKEKMSSELLQQLISNNNKSNGSKKTNWLLDGHKAACISQPSDSVLMNLLENNTDSVVGKKVIIPHPSGANLQRYLLRVNSKSLLLSDGAPISSFLSLTEKDYEVNAPVNNNLLQGEDLIKALDICDTI